MYYPNMHKNFSMFSTVGENYQIDKYLKRKQQEEEDILINYGVYFNELKGGKIGSNEIGLIPHPKKEHTFCLLCNCNFDNYYMHINTKEHYDKIEKNKKLFKRIGISLQRIRDFWNKDKKILRNERHIESLEKLFPPKTATTDTYIEEDFSAFIDSPKLVDNEVKSKESFETITVEDDSNEDNEENIVYIEEKNNKCKIEEDKGILKEVNISFLIKRKYNEIIKTNNDELGNYEYIVLRRLYKKFKYYEQVN